MEGTLAKIMIVAELFIFSVIHSLNDLFLGHFLQTLYADFVYIYK